MNKKLFQEANDLYKTIDSLEKVISEYEKEKHWIYIYTQNYKYNLKFGHGFTEKLIKKLKELKAEYEKEFEELE